MRPSRFAGSCLWTLTISVSARSRGQPHTCHAKTIPWHTVTMSLDGEPSLPIHQFGQIKSDHAGVVADEANMMRRLQLNQGHRPSVFFVHQINTTRLASKAVTTDQAIGDRDHDRMDPIIWTTTKARVFHTFMSTNGVGQIPGRPMRIAGLRIPKPRDVARVAFFGSHHNGRANGFAAGVRVGWRGEGVHRTAGGTL